MSARAGSGCCSRSSCPGLFRINFHGDYGVASALGSISYLMTGVVAWIYPRQGMREGGAR